jgi:probable HAF family extracellular repeat protein
MKNNKVFSTMLLGAAVPIVSGEAAEFIPLGSLSGSAGSSAALDISADGSTVLGRSDSADGQQLFRWNFETGFSIIPTFDPGTSFPNFFATSISSDGSSVAGYVFTGTTLEALKWSADNGFLQLGILPSDGGFEMSLAVDISGDGNSIVGYGSAPNTPASAALLWTTSMGLTSLGFLAEDEPDGVNISQSFSYAISTDGSTVVGASSSTVHQDRGSEAFRWTQGEGMVALGILTGEIDSTATAVSVDGSVIVGTSGFNAFRWTPEGGMQPIGQFLPTAVSADGNVVVGTSHFRDLAMIWTPETSAQPLQTYLQEQLNLTLPGWQALYEVNGISADGSTIAGTGLNAAGLTEAFLATIGSSVQSTGSISFGGPVSLFLVDPDGKRYGTNPENGESLNEIPELTLTEEEARKIAAWTDIVSGDHLVYFTGTSAGNYDVSFEFLHLNNEPSSASFTGELLRGGVHIYSAHVSADTHEGAQYQLIYADTDGDKVVDGSDAVLKSDTRSTIFVGNINTGAKNRVLSNGTTLNDVVACQLKKSTSRGSFVSAMNEITKLWVSAGLITKADATAIHDATTIVTISSFETLSTLSVKPARKVKSLSLQLK